MAHLILSGVTTVAATCQLVLGTHLVPADVDVIVLLQLLSFETSLQPGKCVSSKCLYDSSSVVVYWPLGSFNIPRGAVLDLSRSLYTLDVSDAPSVLAQKSCQDSRLLWRNSFVNALLAAWCACQSCSSLDLYDLRKALLAAFLNTDKSWFHNGTFFLPETLRSGHALW